jgi:hypothetical protein
MSIRAMPPVNDQPEVSLLSWKVVRFQSKEVQADFVFGWDAANSCGRVSSVITAKEGDAARLRTRSGRTYRLLGCRGCDPDGEFVFRQKYAELIALCEFSDVSQEYESLAVPCTVV